MRRVSVCPGSCPGSGHFAPGGGPVPGAVVTGRPMAAAAAAAHGARIPPPSEGPRSAFDGCPGDKWEMTEARNSTLPP